MASKMDIVIKAHDRASKQIRFVESQIDDLSRTAKRTSLIIGGLSSSIAGLAPAVAGVGALASTFASAGVGALAFGAVAVSSISKVVKASEKIAEAEKAIAQADTTEERTKAKQKLAQIMGQLSREQKKAIKTLNEFKGWWSSFTSQFDSQVFRVMSQGLKLIENIMTALKPAIKTVGTVLGDFLTQLNNGFKAKEFKQFFNYINTTVGQNLSNILKSAGNLFKGFFGILRAFAPLSDTVSAKMVKVTSSFAKWGQQLSSSKSFKKFIAYAKKNTPPFLNMLKNISVFIGQVVTALAPLGSAMLRIIQQFTKWLTTSTLVQGALNALKQVGQFFTKNLLALKIVLISLIGLFVTLRVTLGIISLVTKCIAIFRTLKTTFLAVRTAMLAMNTAWLACPITWIIAGIVAVIAIGVLLWKNWDVVKKKALQLWAKMKEIWNNIKTAVFSVVTSIAKKVTLWVINLIRRFFELRQKVLNYIKDLAMKLIAKFVNMMGSAKDAVMTGIRNMISAIAGWVGDFIDAGKGLLSAFAKGVVSGIGKAIDAVQGAIGKIRNFLPFSPAKKGPLSDLDKSGASFFPTFAKGMAKGVNTAVKMASSGMNALSNELDTRSGGIFGMSGRQKITLVMEHKHYGTVEVEGNGGSESAKIVGKSVTTQTETMDLSDLRQTFRRN